MSRKSGSGPRHVHLKNHPQVVRTQSSRGPKHQSRGGQLSKQPVNKTPSWARES
jgi:hypothetical protein